MQLIVWFNLPLLHSVLRQRSHYDSQAHNPDPNAEWQRWRQRTMDGVKPAEQIMSLKQLNLMRIMDMRANSTNLLAAPRSLSEKLASRVRQYEGMEINGTFDPAT